MPPSWERAEARGYHPLACGVCGWHGYTDGRHCPYCPRCSECNVTFGPESPCDCPEEPEEED